MQSSYVPGHFCLLNLSLATSPAGNNSLWKVGTCKAQLGAKHNRISKITNILKRPVISPHVFLRPLRLPLLPFMFVQLLINYTPWNTALKTWVIIIAISRVDKRLFPSWELERWWLDLIERVYWGKFVY